MNIKTLLFYLSLFINKKERKSEVSFIMKSFTTKIINRNINGFVKRTKKDKFIPFISQIINNTAFYNPSNSSLNEGIAEANRVGDDRIFLNEMKENEPINKSMFDDIFIMNLIKLIFD